MVYRFLGAIGYVFRIERGAFIVNLNHKRFMGMILFFQLKIGDFENSNSELLLTKLSEIHPHENVVD